MQGIRNIIFDLGGVFLNLNYQLTEDAFVAAGVTDFHTYFTQHFSNPLFEQLETGKISEQDFYQGFREQTGTSINDETIRDAWNAMLLDFPAARLQWLNEVSKRYRIFLFSNTNQIHYDAFMARFTQDHPGVDFNSYFIKAYYSQYMGLRKPYPEAFQFILNEQQLNPAETLFIDDTSKNITGAQAVGLQTIYLEKGMEIVDIKL